jgi:hypothetical protein
LVPLVAAAWLPGRRWYLVASASLGMVALLATLQFVAAPWLFSPRSAMAHQGIMIHDLAGIEARTGNRPLSGHFAGQPDHEFIARTYSPMTVDTLIFGSDKRVPVSSDKESVRRLQQQWLTTITHEWRAYLTHRAAVFEAMLFAPPDNRYVMHETTDKNPWGYVFRPNGLTQVFFRPVKSTGASFVFAGWFWLLAAATGLCVAALVPIAKPARWTVIAIFASALGYFLPYFFVAVAPSYRYFYWPAVAGTLGWSLMAMLIIRRRTGRAGA